MEDHGRKDLEMLHSSFFYEEHRLFEKIKSNKSRNFSPDSARRKTVIVFITPKKTPKQPCGGLSVVGSDFSENYQWKL